MAQARLAKLAASARGLSASERKAREEEMAAKRQKKASQEPIQERCGQEAEKQRILAQARGHWQLYGTYRVLYAHIIHTHTYI